MTIFTPTHVHPETGEQFVIEEWSGLTVGALDAHGECRTFKVGVLIPIQPIEEWEPVQNTWIAGDGILTIQLKSNEWVDLTHPDVRLVDGCRLERRKA